MTQDNPNILSHISIGVNDYERAKAFYMAVMPVLGCRVVMEFPGAIAFGKAYPEFWVQKPYDQKPATVGNGTHVGFVAPTREAVDEFFAAAMAAGATTDGDPGHRHEYGEPYYGCFVRDPEGHKIEATHWDFELAQKLGMG